MFTSIPLVHLRYFFWPVPIFKLVGDLIHLLVFLRLALIFRYMSFLKIITCKQSHRLFIDLITFIFISFEYVILICLTITQVYLFLLLIFLFMLTILNFTVYRILSLFLISLLSPITQIFGSCFGHFDFAPFSVLFS